MLVTHVFVHVKPECIDDFKAICADNSGNSRQEPGCVRFDVIQQKDDPQRFVLMEVYRTSEDVDNHKQTDHYHRWRETVEDMQVERRYSIKYEIVHPDPEAW